MTLAGRKLLVKFSIENHKLYPTLARLKNNLKIDAEKSSYQKT